MIIDLEGIKFDIDFFHTVENDKPYLLFLHGFTGSSDDWKAIAPNIDKDYSSIGIDIIGHGETDSPEDLSFYSTDAIANQLSNIIEQTIKKKVIPIGYSMGGRAALNFAIKHPEKIEALILESTTPGIKDEELRNDRIKKDAEIIEYLGSHSLREFIDYWMDKEIFNTQKRFSEKRRKEIKLAKLKNNPTGLINSLRGFGTGAMPPLFDQLKNIKCKTFLITGELDTKFTNINSEIVSLFPDVQHKIIKNAGHNTHLEEPKKFAEEINIFLSSF